MNQKETQTQTQTLSDNELNTIIGGLEPQKAVETPKTQEQINQEALQILSNAQEQANSTVQTGTGEVANIFYWGAGIIIAIGIIQILAVVAIKTIKKAKRKK